MAVPIVYVETFPGPASADGDGASLALFADNGTNQHQTILATVGGLLSATITSSGEGSEHRDLLQHADHHNVERRTWAARQCDRCCRRRRDGNGHSGDRLPGYGYSQAVSAWQAPASVEQARVVITTFALGLSAAVYGAISGWHSVR